MQRRMSATGPAGRAMKPSSLALLLVPAAGAVRPVHYLLGRHGHEVALMTELGRAGMDVTTSPCAGLVRVDAEDSPLPEPAYALQILPAAVEVRAASIKGLAQAAAQAVGSSSLLAEAPRGSLAVHALVPDLLRGVPPGKAKLLRRCEMVASTLSSTLRRSFVCARPGRDGDDGTAAAPAPPPLLQLLLLEPELLVVSLAPAAAHRSGIGRWPVSTRGGYRDCSLDGDMPSSAYRKLLESFVLLEAQPRPGEACVDLGACPGGWTAALRRVCGARVTAVDRQPLAAALMADEAVRFVRGDAFAFEPPAGGVAWMVSDVIAAPERCIELVERWCRQRWARSMVVTMKFKGETPEFDAIDEARGAAVRHGWRFRACHHFSNKNEVSLMLVDPQHGET